MPDTLKAGRLTVISCHFYYGGGLCREGLGLPGLLGAELRGKALSRPGLARPDPRLQQRRASRS